MLREMVLSMTHHTADSHDKFPGHEKFRKCSHLPLTRFANLMCFVKPATMPCKESILHNSRLSIKDVVVTMSGNNCSGEERVVPFLTAGEPAHTVLVEHLHSKPFQEQLALCTHGRHTGGLEVLHSMFLTYVSKRVDYDPPSYAGRIQLALLDHNENCRRKVVLGM